MKVLRIMTRLNIGGPSTHAAILNHLDPRRFSVCLAAGHSDADEGDRSGAIGGGRFVRLKFLRRPMRPWRDTSAFFEILSLLWKERPRILHTHMAKAGSLGRLAGLLYNRFGPGRKAGQKAILIHTFHGHVLDGYFPGWISGLFTLAERWLARRTDCLIAVSPAVRDSLLQNGIGIPAQWKVVPLGLDLEPLEALELPAPAATLRCGLVGRLVPIKNPELFLQAIGELAHNGAAGRIQAEVVGDGPLRSEMERKARRLRLEKVLIFSGWTDDLPGCYRRLDAVCITSWNEGTPLSLIEAMAAGRVAVGTDVGGVRDLLGADRMVIPEGGFVEASRGLLVRAGDEKGLAAALETLVKQPELRSRLARAGRAHARAQFSRQRLLDDIGSLYEDLSKKPPAAEARSRRKGRFLIMIDQSTRDAVGQLLTGHYLQQLGHKVAYCNQVTMRAMSQRFRPDVLYTSWCSSEEGSDAVLRSVRPLTRIALVDQEGRRSGEMTFKRALRLHGNGQIRSARLADKIIAWEENQARWISDEGIPAEKVFVAGSARLDPYMAAPQDDREERKHLGITLRADPLTSNPMGVLRSIFGYRSVNPKEGIRPALPASAQYEDWIWEVQAITRVMFQTISEVRKTIQAPIIVRPGPWERYRMYDFLPGQVPNLQVLPFMLQNDYVRQCFATVDCYSTLGIESLLAGTPVISIVNLVPGLEQHAGGAEGTRFNAVYRPFFWQPKSFEELLEMVRKAEKGELPVSPDPEGFKKFMRESYGWPGERPASFKTADLLCSLLDAPRTEPEQTPAEAGSLKQLFYRHVPFSPAVPAAKLLWQYFFGVNADSIRRYHYLRPFYPHHAAVRRIFETLWRRYGQG